MKTRLEALPLTPDDWAIWTGRPQRTPDMGASMHACCRTDRLDADFMYLGMDMRYGRLAKYADSTDLRWYLAFGHSKPPERYEYSVSCATVHARRFDI